MKIELVKTLAEPEDRRTVWSRSDAPELFDELHLVGELVGTGTLSSGPSGDASYSFEVYQIAGDEASFALVSPLTNGEYWLCSQA